MDQDQSLRLEWRTADELNENPQNWRRHPAHQIKALEGVLAEVGWAGALLYNEQTGRLIDGHARKKVAKGKRVPVLIGNWTEEQEKKILLTLDPIASIAEMDADAFKSLLGSVEWSTQEMAAAMEPLWPGQKGARELVEPPAQIDKAAELKAKWGTELGQLWQIGPHRLLCGDWVESKLPDAKQYALLTDPPYGMNLDTDWSDVQGSMRSMGHKNGTRGKRYERVIGDDKPFDPAPLCKRFSAADEMFLFGADYYIGRLPQWDSGSWLVWDKRKESQSEAIGAEFELLWSKAKHKRRVLRHDWFGFLSSHNGSDARNRMHPTQKPVSLLAEIIELWIKPKVVIYDPFCGSGSTLLAAHQLGRIGYGVEIDPGYVAVTLERLSALGLKPELAK